LQELWRAGDRDAAAAAVPLDLGRLTNLIGTEAEVAARLELHASVGITTVLAKLDGGPDDHLALLERLLPLLP
jgi:alkanesulfonate monooxygenase SsuD/methylene tetrahydromethanopterin reductase-like flavin-dependent oxidoreductase (luciferase family)